MCGLFGFSCMSDSLTAEEASGLINALAKESCERGTDACGAAYILDHKLVIEKEAKSALEIEFKLPSGTKAVMAHTRHATQGSERKNYNNHPFLGRLKGGGLFSLAHNGIITNDRTIRAKHKLPGTRIQTDSYIAVQMLEAGEKLDMKALSSLAEEVHGSFTFSILDDQNNLYLIKGDSPIAILHFEELGLYVYASTEKLLWRALSSSPLFYYLKSSVLNKKDRVKETKLTAGQILKISSDGILECGVFNFRPYGYLPFELNWWDYGVKKHWTDHEQREQDEYISNLKAVALSMGFRCEDVENLLQTGWTPEEIEEFIYSGEPYELETVGIVDF